jgi:hypothetical protein
MIYTIKKNKHYSSIIPKIVCNNYIKGTINFLNDVKYDVENQGDTNKIIGLSDNWHHHKDSIRLGWRYYKEKNQIMVISYVNGKRSISYLFDFEVGVEYNFLILITDNYYLVGFKENEEFRNLQLELKLNNLKSINRYSNWKLPRLLLKPYFGGKQKAPKEFKIKIEIK